MIDKNTIKNPFGKPVTYNSIKPAMLSETRVSIHNEAGAEVRVINMNSRADGILEIEFRDMAEETPFGYRRG